MGMGEREGTKWRDEKDSKISISRNDSLDHHDDISFFGMLRGCLRWSGDVTADTRVEPFSILLLDSYIVSVTAIVLYYSLRNR